VPRRCACLVDTRDSAPEALGAVPLCMESSTP
jgi:hypothetical protein